MDSFRQWVLCIIIAAAAGTFACAVSPRGSTDKTVRTIVGIFVVASICAPLSQIDFEEISVPAFAESYSLENSDDMLNGYMLPACESAVKSEVLQTAAEYGFDVVSIAFDAYMDENGCIIIRDIQVNIQYRSAESISDFSRILAEKLGVPVTVNAE